MTCGLQGHAGMIEVDVVGVIHVPVTLKVVLLKQEVAVGVLAVLFIWLQNMTTFVTVTFPISSQAWTVVLPSSPTQKVSSGVFEGPRDLGTYLDRHQCSL